MQRTTLFATILLIAGAFAVVDQQPPVISLNLEQMGSVSKLADLHKVAGRTGKNECGGRVFPTRTDTVAPHSVGIPCASSDPPRSTHAGNVISQ